MTGAISLLNVLHALVLKSNLVGGFSEKKKKGKLAVDKKRGIQCNYYRNADREAELILNIKVTKGGKTHSYVAFSNF